MNCPRLFHDCEDVLKFSYVFPLQDGSGYLWYALVHSQKPSRATLDGYLKYNLIFCDFNGDIHQPA